jgi:hypothetical protein
MCACGVVIQQQIIPIRLESLARRPISLTAETPQQPLCFPQRLSLASQHAQRLVRHLCEGFAFVGQTQTRMVDQFVCCRERTEEPFQLNLAKGIIFDGLDVSVLIVVRRGWRDGFAVRVEE